MGLVFDVLKVIRLCRCAALPNAGSLGGSREKALQPATELT
jgi:hypothetical protein